MGDPLIIGITHPNIELPDGRIIKFQNRENLWVEEWSKPDALGAQTLERSHYNLTEAEYESLRQEHPEWSLPKAKTPQEHGTGTGNTIGRVQGQSPAAAVPPEDANPEVTPETPEETGFLGGFTNSASEAWTELKGQAQTVWDATGITSSPEAAAAARGRIWEGTKAVGSLAFDVELMVTPGLMGTPAGWDAQQRIADRAIAIGGQIKDRYVGAYEKGGLSYAAGVGSFDVVRAGIEALGAKGAGMVASSLSGATKVAESANLARSAEEAAAAAASKAEEVAVAASKADDAVAGAKKAENAAAKTKEHKQEEHKQEEHKQEEHKQEEHKQEEHKQEEHKQEEHKQEDNVRIHKRTPRGRRTVEQGSQENRRSLWRENESADKMAAKGYDVEQNPDPPPGSNKNPDYRVNGEYADAYAPKTGNVDNVRDAISGKVSSGQADNIVLNLDDSPATFEDIQGVLSRKPVNGLGWVIGIKGSDVLRIYP